jgi:hypothetical protein
MSSPDYLGVPPETELKLNQPVPFSVRFTQDLISITQKKLDLARYPSEQSDFGADDWSQGAKVAKVAQLARYWRHEYDWVKQEVSDSIKPQDMQRMAANQPSRNSSTTHSTTTW